MRRASSRRGGPVRHRAQWATAVGRPAQQLRRQGQPGTDGGVHVDAGVPTGRDCSVHGRKAGETCRDIIGVVPCDHCGRDNEGDADADGNDGDNDVTMIAASLWYAARGTGLEFGSRPLVKFAI